MTVYAVTVGLSPLSPLGAISALTPLDDDEVVLLHTNGSAEVAKAVANAVKEMLPGLKVKQRSLGDGSSTPEMIRCLFGLENAVPVIAGGTNAMVLAVRSVLGSTGWFCDVDGFELRCDDDQEERREIPRLGIAGKGDPLLALARLHSIKGGDLSSTSAGGHAEPMLNTITSNGEELLHAFPASGAEAPNGWDIGGLGYPPTFNGLSHEDAAGAAAEAYVLWAAEQVLRGRLEEDLALFSNWTLMNNGLHVIEFDVLVSRGQLVAVVDASAMKKPGGIADKVAQVAYKARQCFGEFVSTAVFCTASDARVAEVSTLWDTPWHEKTKIFNPNAMKVSEGGSLADSAFGEWLLRAVRLQ